ncbi:PIN domain-like protein [Scenedesmus sp. NREL 46B-D3]|nr:PIN domain-like protein [Scenedesmus sp. NREL 46B-D3]
MGINGLLPALKPIAKAVHVSKYRGQRAAVDGYSWLHKGAYCCARELCEGTWTDKYVAYFMSRIQMLRTHGVEPLVVFDGGRLPIKGDEESSRHRARAEAREKAAAHLTAGNMAAAVECYQRCVDISPAMAKHELKVRGVPFIVAPYEADAQMAYLARRGDVQLVITEDSDLLAYGCPRVLYKLDRTGNGEEFCVADLPNCTGLPLSGFTSDQFLQLCVMAGCDFLAQLPGIGLKKAHGVLRKYRSFTKVVKMLRFNGTRVPQDYEVRFQLALWAFKHCRVYCPAAKALVHLVPLPHGGLGSADVDVPQALTHLAAQQQQQRLDFLGPDLPAAVACGIAEGGAALKLDGLIGWCYVDARLM